MAPALPLPSPRLRRAGAALVAGALLAIASAAGCGGDSGSREDGPSGSSDLELCRSQMRVYCEQQSVCDQKDYVWGSIDECIEAIGSMCDLFVMNPAVAETYGELLGANTRECFEQQAALGPSCRTPPTVTEADVEAYRAACSRDKVLPAPTKQLGEPCLIEYQCPRGALCTEPEEGCGTCVEVTEGKPCERRRDCGTFAGFECTREGICQRYAKVGESCEARTCDPLASLVCGADGTCATHAKRDEDCSARPCDEGLFLYCKPSTKRCTPKPRNAGESCAEDKVCGAGLFCNAGGTCKPLLTEGATCGGVATTEDPCDPLAGLRCDIQSGTCKLAYARVGESCEGSYPPSPDCWQSDCRRSDEPSGAGTCVAYARANESCADRQCATFLLCTAEKICKPMAEAIRELDAGAPAFGAENPFAACMPTSSP